MARYVIVGDRSRIWADAKSSVHPIHVETAGLAGHLEVEVADGEARLGTPTRIELEVERLKSGNALIDSDLQRRLEARRFPLIEGELREATALTGSRHQLHGDLTLHGVARSLQVEVTARPGGDGTVEVEGEKVIDMRDFDLTPPRFLMLKVEPFVKIRARLVARRQD